MPWLVVKNAVLKDGQKLPCEKSDIIACKASSTMDHGFRYPVVVVWYAISNEELEERDKSK